MKSFLKFAICMALAVTSTTALADSRNEFRKKARESALAFAKSVHCHEYLIDLYPLEEGEYHSYIALVGVDYECAGGNATHRNILLYIEQSPLGRFMIVKPEDLLKDAQYEFYHNGEQVDLSYKEIERIEVPKQGYITFTTYAVREDYKPCNCMIERKYRITLNLDTKKIVRARYLGFREWGKG